MTDRINAMVMFALSYLFKWPDWPVADLCANGFWCAGEVPSGYIYDKIPRRAAADAAAEEGANQDTCVVCWKRAPNCELACGHRFCTACVQTWSERSSKCPLCREHMLPSLHTPPIGLELPWAGVLVAVTVSFATHRPGVTINNRRVITRLQPNDAMARARVRVGDVLLSINGIPCREGEDGSVVRVLDRAADARLTVVCHVARRRRFCCA